MSAELYQLFALAVTKTKEAVGNADLSQILSLDVRTLQAAIALERDRLGIENAQTRGRSSFAQAETVTAVKIPLTVIQEQYELSHEIAKSFMLFREHLEDNSKVALTVCECEPNGYVMIEAGGNLVITDHYSIIARPEPIRPEEILFFGRKIAKVIEPDNLQRLQFLVEQMHRFQW